MTTSGWATSTIIRCGFGWQQSFVPLETVLVGGPIFSGSSEYPAEARANTIDPGISSDRKRRNILRVPFKAWNSSRAQNLGIMEEYRRLPGWRLMDSTNKKRKTPQVRSLRRHG
jgi:hypothetical protein